MKFKFLNKLNSKFGSAIYKIHLGALYTTNLGLKLSLRILRFIKICRKV